MKKVILSLSLVVFLLAGFTTVANASVIEKAVKVTLSVASDDNSFVYQNQDKKKEAEAAKTSTKTNTKTDGCAKSCDKAAKSCCDKGVKTSCDKSAASSCDKSKADASKATTTDKKADADKK
jgi:hypothetical protein